MGWTFQHRAKGTYTNEQFFREEFPSLADGFIKVASPNTSEVYIAYRRPNGEVTALVILTQWVHKDYYNFGYKEMDESAGPAVDSCPASILDILTDPPNEWAKQWRARCRARIAARARRHKKIVGATWIPA